MGFFRCRSFRLDILTAFCSLLLITFSAVIFYNYRNTSGIVLMLCEDLMQQTTRTVIDQTMGFLAPPANLAQETAQFTATGILPLTDRAALERFAIISVNSNPQVAMFFIGDQAGNFLFAKSESGNLTATKIVNRTGNPPKTLWKNWQQDLKLINTKKVAMDTFDPRQRPWYQGAASARSLHWTDLYIFYTSGEPGITVSYPIITSKGKVLGVVGCDIELAQLSHFLESLKISKHGIAFILNDRQELVAYPEPARLLAQGDDPGRLRPVRVESLDNPAVVAASRHYRQTGQTKFTVETGGARYLASFASFPASFGNPWKVAVIIPENDFIGKVKDLTRRVLLMCVFFLALAVLMAVFLARHISKPILQLARETDNIRNFRLDEPLELKSPISEVMVLKQAVNRMKVTLRSFLRFAPEQLVREVVLAGRELMLGGDRRDVTLLFSDLRNFTQLAEHLRPEDVVQIVNAHFDAMVRIIADHNGYVVDFLGDSLFAVFGAPQADPDHAWQAVRCATAMQLTREKLNEARSDPSLPRLEMGLGLNSGSCVVGNMGSFMRIKYGVVGHAVNLAARIETFTVGGQVLLSEATRQLVADRVEVAGPFTAYGKGVEGAITIWELRGVRQEPELTLPPTVPGLTPLARPLPVGFRLVTGKQIAPDLHGAALTQVSLTGAALTSDLALDDFAAVQLQFNQTGEKTIRCDGKVVAADAARATYIIRFSPPDEAAAAFIARLLAADSASSRNFITTS